MSKLKLANNFPAVRHEDWQALVEKGLRGAGFDSLIQQNEDGFTRGPLSTADNLPQDIAALPRAGAPLLEGRPWHICAPVNGPELEFANKQMLEDLNGGASAVRVTLDDAGFAGVPLHKAIDVKRLFDKVHLDLIPVHFTSPAINEAKLLASAPMLQDAYVYLGFQPEDDDEDIAYAKHIMDWAAAKAPNWRCLEIDVAQSHISGLTDAQELAVMATSIVDYMAEFGAERTARNLIITLATHQDGHMCIAKIRAARRIYARIAETYGLSDMTVPIHAISSERMMQSTDPWTNMLRVMSAGFGAVVGGADFITTLPFTQPQGDATPFGHRIARNAQLMMMEESHLGQVQDAAFGSYFHERMTESLAQEAWKIFQHLEADGDIVENLNAAIDARKEKGAPILGVTLHPLEKESSAFRKAKTRRPLK